MVQAGACAVYVDGTDDSRTSHQLIARRGATTGIPPRKTAGLWVKGHPRNEVVLVMRKEGLAHWKKKSWYHCRLSAGKITLRKYSGQAGEMMAM
jgi:hypothetical protein